MNFKLLSTCFSVLLTMTTLQARELAVPQAIAADLDISKASNKIFTKFGTVTQTAFVPEGHPENFSYDLVYYLPKELKNKKNWKTLVYLHGGGASTLSRGGSLSVIRGYVRNLQKLADAQGFALIMPSGSALNWGGHMIHMLRSLNKVIRQTLPVDPNAIALSGHSMGGMGITRTAYWLADEYAFFLPNSSAMVPRYQAITYALKAFANIVYHQLQGDADHFQSFITDNRSLIREDRKMSTEFNYISGLTVEFYRGSHNPDWALYSKVLADRFMNTPRRLHQKRLLGMFYNQDEVVVNNFGNREYYAPRTSYFWVKAKSFTGYKEVVEFEAVASEVDNSIEITIGQGIEKLRVLLSSKLLNLSEPVTIKVNGVVKFQGLAPRSGKVNEALIDAGYDFESAVEFAL